MQKLSILVTGAAGFIGSYVTDELVNMGHQVFTVDNLSGGLIENINKKSEFTKLDLTNSNRTKKYIMGIKPQIIFHLAADATEGRSQFTPLSSTRNNYLAYLNILIPALGNNLKKMVLFSSMSVYGSQNPPFSEEMETKPDDIYGVAKTAMERATSILAKVHKFKYVIIRPHNVYGPRQNMRDPYRNVVAIFINRLLNNKKFFIYGDGEQKRAFTYIDDLIPPIIKAGLGDYNGQIFNMGSTKAVTINRLTEIILSSFFGANQIPAHLRPQYLPSRPMEVKYAFCTNDKAEKLLDYKETINLEKGTAITIEWAKKQGHQKFKYLKGLEIISKDTPKTWVKKLI